MLPTFFISCFPAELLSFMSAFLPTYPFVAFLPFCHAEFLPYFVVAYPSSSLLSSRFAFLWTCVSFDLPSALTSVLVSSYQPASLPSYLYASLTICFHSLLRSCRSAFLPHCFPADLPSYHFVLLWNCHPADLLFLLRFCISFNL